MIYDADLKEKTTNELGLPSMMSLDQARAYLNCGRTKIYELANRPDFPSYKIGGRYMVDKYELVNWIRHQ